MTMNTYELENRPLSRRKGILIHQEIIPSEFFRQILFRLILRLPLN